MNSTPFNRPTAHVIQRYPKAPHRVTTRWLRFAPARTHGRHQPFSFGAGALRRKTSLHDHNPARALVLQFPIFHFFPLASFRTGALRSSRSVKNRAYREPRQDVPAIWLRFAPRPPILVVTRILIERSVEICEEIAPDGAKVGSQGRKPLVSKPKAQQPWKGGRR